MLLLKLSNFDDSFFAFFRVYILYFSLKFSAPIIAMRAHDRIPIGARGKICITEHAYKSR